MPAGDISQEEEIELVRRARSGDPDATARMIRAYGASMMAVARRFMRCEEDCNDAVQDAFISALKSLDQFEASSRLSTWLYRITVNSCLMKLRTSRRRRETSIEDLLPTFNWTGHHTRHPARVDQTVQAAESEETRTLVRKAIDELPDAYRTVILLRDIEGLDTAEAARLLDTTENNIKTRLHRARQALRTLLEPLMRQ
jgi:RNA polymerase sigma-70 factor (ECF subfamily)